MGGDNPNGFGDFSVKAGLLSHENPEGLAKNVPQDQSGSPNMGEVAGHDLHGLMAGG